jgi:PAS domain S-box-containing protein
MSAPPDVPDHPPRVLIVDDELRNRTLLEAMLSQEGFVLLTAASGEEALAIVAQQPPPDLILLDVMMPGMDGYRVASAIKSSLATKNIPIIMVTALDDRNARMLGLSAGAEDFLTKPVDRAELCMRVRNLLRLKAYGDYHDKYSQKLAGDVATRTADLLERTKTLEQQTEVLSEQAALLDLAQDGILVLDMDNRILFWSRGAEIMYGWTRVEALGRNAYELLRTEFPEPIEVLEATLLRQSLWEGELIKYRRDGSRVVVASRWALQRDAGGVPVRILSISNDITERQRADSERIALTDRLSLATAVARVGVWEWDLASDSLTWDATMFEIYGLEPVLRVPYERWTLAVHPEDLPAVETSLRRAIAQKGHGAADFRISLPDGSIRSVSSVERAVLDDRGVVVRVIGVNMDVTARKEEEEALEQSRLEQLRFKDEFLSHVSHELRSPLTAIKQFTTILLGGIAGELNKEQREFQQIVLKNIGQLQSMIDDLLEVTRLETGKLTVEPECVSVSDAVADCLDTLQGSANAKGVSLTSELPADLSSAYADQTRLRQIMIILLDNAIKFTPEGGGIDVQARISPQDPEFLLIEVSDTGCGISPEMTESIFERLYQVTEQSQSSRKGLGLGLYICKQLVTRQGGKIWAKRRPKKGSTFAFTLPVFSLKTLVAPLLEKGKWPSESLALVMLELKLPDSSFTKDSREDWSREARSLLQRCLLPDLDVLLPKMSSGPDGERFFIAAFADELGASVLTNRIRDQFERLPRLKQPGVTVSASFRMLVTLPREGSESMESILGSMATRLEAAIKFQTSPEGTHHG